MDTLEPRKQIILRAVIMEYVAGAEPVASELLTVKYDLGVRSATVRNELSEMSDMGLLEQPHTSAGRIPSDRGYRYFIDHLMVSGEPNVQARKRVASGIEEGEALNLLLSQTIRALSRVTRALSVATTVKGANLAARSVVVSAFGPQQALLVLGLSNGDVHSKILECPRGLTLTDVGAVNDVLLREYVGKPLRAIQRIKPPDQLPHSGAELLKLCGSTLKSMARDLTRGNVITHGEEYLFGQPEFAHEAGQLSEILDHLKDSDGLYDAVSRTPEAIGNVTIGKENTRSELHRLSVIRNRFFVGPDEAGTIAIISPTRTNYESAIPLVDFAARAISDALTKYSGSALEPPSRRKA